MYFAVQFNEDNYHLYQNTIYNLREDLKVNVLWPINNVDGLCKTMRLRDEKQETTLSRSWNGRTHRQLKWTYTGSSVKIRLKHYNTIIIAAIISMTRENFEQLPYCSSSFTPIQSVFVEEKDINYSLADVYLTEPNSFDNTRPIPIERVTSVAPLAMAAPQPMPLAQPLPQPRPQPLPQPRPQPLPQPRPQPSAMAQPQPIPLAALPPHITKIVLADAIRKNEVCPITSEDITETNATVTSCGHVFTTAAITHWLSLPSSRGLCPVCKQKC